MSIDKDPERINRLTKTLIGAITSGDKAKMTAAVTSADVLELLKHGDTLMVDMPRMSMIEVTALHSITRDRMLQLDMICGNPEIPVPPELRSLLQGRLEVLERVLEKLNSVSGGVLGKASEALDSGR
jgi:hypothetical protein